jgi:cell division protein YceG involved in septum cleavage
MKEFITVIVAFILVVGLALYMYIGNNKADVSIIKYENAQELLIKDNQQLKLELQELKNEVHLTDSIYHKN